MNDWSARDLQRREMKVSLGPAKGKDFGHHARARGWSPPTNSSPTATPTASWPSTCACRSTAPRSARTCCPTWAGRSKSSSPTPRAAPGSAPGTCSARAPAATAAAWPSCGAAAAGIDPPPLQPGDVVEMTVEGIGTIRNTVVAGRRTSRRCARGPAAAADPRSGRHRASVVVTGAAAGPGRGRGRGCSPPAARPSSPSTWASSRLRICAGGGLPAAGRHRPGRLDRSRRDLAERYGRVHGLVANAGITWRARLLDVDPGRRSPRARGQRHRRAARHPGPRPADDRRGFDRPVGSLAALTGHFPVAYTASKWALRGLAKAAAWNSAPAGSGSTPSTPATSRPR